MEKKVSNLYELFDVDNNCSLKDLNIAFKKKALKYHPDKVKDNFEEAKETFEIICNAYNILSNEESRKMYDQYLGNSNFIINDFETLKTVNRKDEFLKNDFDISKFNCEQCKDEQINIDDANKIHETILKNRKKQDKELLPKKIMDDIVGNEIKFNYLFEKEKKETQGEIIEYSGLPEGANYSIQQNFCYSSLNNLGNLYDECGDDTYLKFFNNVNKENKKDYEIDDNDLCEYKKRMQYVNDDALEQKINDYENERLEYECDDPGDYGIFNKLNITEEQMETLQNHNYITSKLQNLSLNRKI